MKKLLLIILIVLLIAGSLLTWIILGSATNFTGKSKYIYVREGKDARSQIMDQVKEDIIKYPSAFNLVSNQMNVWKRVKPGRYEIKPGENILTIARKLRNNQQSPVSLVINKLRTFKDFAKLVGKNFSTDSTTVISYLSNPDSLAKWNVDSNSFYTLIIPDTYIIYWHTPLSKIIDRLATEQDKFWQKDDRLQKAARLGLTPQQIHIVASIVEEETNKKDEKGHVASVYINRYKIGMPLGADPTIKFALKDFSLKRILFQHLNVSSPYNTYKNKGLPPGPICTPSKTTIDAVLNAPQTDYLYFVARSDFNGYHHFSSTYAEHLQYAKIYQKALTEYLKRKQNQQKF